MCNLWVFISGQEIVSWFKSTHAYEIANGPMVSIDVSTCGRQVVRRFSLRNSQLVPIDTYICNRETVRWCQSRYQHAGDKWSDGFNWTLGSVTTLIKRLGKKLVAAASQMVSIDNWMTFNIRGRNKLVCTPRKGQMASIYSSTWWLHQVRWLALTSG